MVAQVPASFLGGRKKKKKSEENKTDIVKIDAQGNQAIQPSPEFPATKGTPEVFRDVKTRKVSGVELPDGRIFTGLSPEDAEEIIQRETKKLKTPEGAREVGSRLATERLGRGVIGAAEQAEAQLEPTSIEKQFESEGGFQELESRQERAIEKVAEIGLTPSVMIGEGIEKLTGKELSNKTAADMAETDFGKVLGVTTAAVSGTALIAALAPVIASTMTFIKANILTTTASQTAAGVGGGILFGNLGVEPLTDRLLDRKKVSDIQSSLNTIGQMSSTLMGTHAAGGIATPKALAELNQLDANLEIVEYQIQQATILDPAVKRSGQYYDVLADIQDQRKTIREARADVLEQTQQFDPTQIAFLIGEMEAIQGKRRRKKIEKGILRETI